MSEDTEDDYYSSSNESHQNNEGQKPSKKRKRAVQNYSLKWTDIDYANASSKGSEYFYCTKCLKDLKCAAGKRVVIKHGQTDTHKEKASNCQTQKKITEVFSKSNALASKVKEAEIKLAAFAVDHNISFNSVGPLVDLLKNIISDSEIVKLISCNRTKCTKIVCNVTGQESFQEMVKFLQTKKFSLLVDESTDVSGTKNLAIITRFSDGVSVKDRFLALLPVDVVTAENLYKVVTSFLQDNNIPWKKNLIGYASDGANNVSGAWNSLSSRLKEDVPHLFQQKCICHSWATCASEACKKLSMGSEGLVRDIYSYFKLSYKRKARLGLIQNILDLKNHQLLKLSGTRWLSLHQVVKRYLEQWDALVMFFDTETKQDRLESAPIIQSKLESPYIKIYFEFLDATLPYFTELNIEMQSTTTKIHRLHERVSQIFKSLLQCFLKRDYVRHTPLDKINFRDSNNQMRDEDIYLGGKLQLEISEDK